MPLLRRADGRYCIRVWLPAARDTKGRVVRPGKQVWRSLKTRRRPPARVVAEVEAALWRELGVVHLTQKAYEPHAVTELACEFLDGLTARRSEGHCRRVACILRMAQDVLGRGSLSGWTAPAIQRYLDDGLRARNWAEGRRPWRPRTAVLHRHCIGRFLGWCLSRGEIAADPIAQVEKPRVARTEVRPPTRRGIVKLLSACRRYDRTLGSRGRAPWLERAARLALGTGLRLGELKGLLWSDVSLRANELHVRASTSKSHKDRTVPLTQLARAALEATPAASREGRVLGSHLQRNDDPVLKRACRRAGISAAGWQNLRQWYCSWFLMRGVPMPTVQRLAGHADITTTARHYTGVTEAHMREEVARADVRPSERSPDCSRRL